MQGLVSSVVSTGCSKCAGGCSWAMAFTRELAHLPLALVGPGVRREDAKDQARMLKIHSSYT
jgi:hypothetical protein